MRSRKITASRRRRTTGLGNPSKLLRVYLSKFPRAIRREILSDWRKRILSMIVAKMHERTPFARHLNTERAKLGVRFDDGTPEMPFILPGMRWQSWGVEAKGTRTRVLASTRHNSASQRLELPELLDEMPENMPRVEGWEEKPSIGREL